MAGLPRFDTDQLARVRSLSGMAKVVIDVRLIVALMTLLWLWLGGQQGWPLALLVCTTTAMLALLLRWDSAGRVVMSHPLVLAVDGALGFTLLALAGPLSPPLLLVASGGLLAGLCLDRRGARVFAPLYAVAWLLVIVSGGPVVEQPESLFLVWVVVPVSLAAMLFAGAAFRSTVLRAAEMECRLRRESQLSAVAEERARLAREMHDSVTKSLHGISLLADTLPTWIDKEPRAAAEHARLLSAAARDATAESRELLVAMRRVDPTSGARAALAQLASRWEATSGRRLGTTLTEVDLAPQTLYELCAIVSEALENVTRHTAAGCDVSLRLADEDGWAVIEVSDEGPGFDEAADGRGDGHFGLLGMRERAARVGGSLRITSRPGAGTLVRVRVPQDLAALGAGPDPRLVDR